MGRSVKSHSEMLFTGPVCVQVSPPGDAVTVAVSGVRIHSFGVHTLRMTRTVRPSVKAVTTEATLGGGPDRPVTVADGGEVPAALVAVTVKS